MSGQPGDLVRSQWRVEPVPHAVAVDLIERHHYSRGAPNTGQTHGLLRAGFELGLDLWGAVLWLPPTKTAAVSVAGDHWHGVLACSRLVVRPDAPRNAASYLLAASMRLVDRARWPILLTYADTAQGHDGAIYRATGWECLGPVKGGDVWLDADGRQRGRKRGARNIPAAELLATGHTRQPSLPKIKYVHRKGIA